MLIYNKDNDKEILSNAEEGRFKKVKGIKERREKMGLSQRDLAKQMNVSQGTIAMWETGVTSPMAKRLPILAKLLKCKIDDLLKCG